MSVRIPVRKNVIPELDTREIKSTDNLFGNFLVKNGLYDEIEITKDNIYELADLIGGHVKIDVYCPKCGENRVFYCERILHYEYSDHDGEIKADLLEDKIVSWQIHQKLGASTPIDKSKEPWSWTNTSIEDDTRLMVFKFVCSMDNSHHLDFIVLTNGNEMKKIGQFPSYADLSYSEIKKYRKIMSDEDEKELKRANGLFSAGIGVGSFVYLRRIFERIIATAAKKGIEASIIDETEYEKAHIDERIKMLSDYLPKVLVDNKVFYGIVSKGIHELSEDDCLEYFPVMNSFIMMILRQWDKIREDEEEEKELAAAINRIATNI